MKLCNKSYLPHSSSTVPGLPLTSPSTFHISRFTFPSALLGLLLSSFLLVVPGRLLAAGEERFSSPQAAADALKAAVEARDTNALHVIFGPAGHSLVSVDVIEATEERELFMNRVKEKVNLVAESDSKEVLQLGADGWPFPIPLVKQGGQWFFDSEAGREEILNRRPMRWALFRSAALTYRPSANMPARIATRMKCSNTPSIFAAPRAPTTASTGPRGRAMSSVLSVLWSRRLGSRATGKRPKS